MMKWHALKHRTALVWPDIWFSHYSVALDNICKWHDIAEITAQYTMHNTLHRPTPQFYMFYFRHTTLLIGQFHVSSHPTTA